MSDERPPEHVDPEAVALMALGEQPEAWVAAHLAACPSCRAELEELRETVAIGRTSFGDDRLAEPAPRVWSAIAEELQLADRNAPLPTLRTGDAAPSSRMRERRPRRSRGRLVATVLALAAVTAGVLTIGGIALFGSGEPTVIASAELDALPDWPGAVGNAVVEEGSDGARDVRVTVDASAGDGYREVWLLTADAESLVSLGVLADGSGTFTIPAEVDLSKYSVVDVSLERADGDPAHSGDSIVRGTLS